MKIELKKIQIFLAMSEETTAFVADVFVDGVKTAYAKNDGHGGGSYYHPYEGKRELLEKAEKFCLTLPAQTIDMGGGRSPFVLEMNLEVVIDDLVTAELKRKEQKKFEKKMVDTIMWGVPNGLQYTQVKFKFPLAKVPTLQLQVYVDKYKKQFKPNEAFLNTNLEALGVKL